MKVEGIEFRTVPACETSPGMRVGVTTPTYGGVGEIRTRITWHVIGEWTPYDVGVAQMVNDRGLAVGLFRRNDPLIV